MTASPLRAGSARRTRPTGAAGIILLAALTLLLCAAGPAAAYIPGTLVWASRTGAAGHYRFYNAVAKAPSGMVYAAGAVDNGAVKGYDILVAKSRTNGAVAWSRQWDGGGNPQLGDYARAGVSDAQGNLYVTGQAAAADFTTNIVTLKYNAAGKLQWARLWDGPGASSDNARAMALDPRGGVVVAGDSYAIGGDRAAVVSYDASGDKRWDYLVAPAGGSDGDKWMSDVAAGSTGDVFAVGTSTESGVDHAWILKLAAADGSLIESAKQYNAGGSRFAAVALRGQQVVAAGWAADAANEEGALAAKYDLAINTETTLLYQDSRGALAQDYAHDVAIGAHGIFIAGETDYTPSGGATVSKSLLLKWGGAGPTAAWHKLYSLPGQGATADDIVLDGSDNAYLGGTALTRRSEEDIFLARYSAAGTRKWARTWHDTGSDDDWVAGMLLGPSPALYVAGGGSVRNGEQAVLLRYAR